MRIRQCFAKSCEFPPGTQVSFHWDAESVGLDKPLASGERGLPPKSFFHCHYLPSIITFSDTSHYVVARAPLKKPFIQSCLLALIASKDGKMSENKMTVSSFLF